MTVTFIGKLTVIKWRVEVACWDLLGYMPAQLAKYLFEECLEAGVARGDDADIFLGITK
jgi:hypothetical protein